MRFNYTFAICNIALFFFNFSGTHTFIPSRYRQTNPKNSSKNPCIERKTALKSLLG